MGELTRIGCWKEYYVCRGMKEWFHDCGVPKDKIHDLTWWETSTYSESLKMVCTPCQHWTKSNSHLFVIFSQILIVCIRKPYKYLCGIMEFMDNSRRT